MTDQPALAIDDLYAASYAATRTRLLATRQVGSRTHFIFDNTDERAALAALDFVNNPAVALRDFLAAFKELRSIAYTARQKGSGQ
jgi:hypothetical protein